MAGRFARAVRIAFAAGLLTAVLFDVSARAHGPRAQLRLPADGVLRSDRQALRALFADAEYVRYERIRLSANQRTAYVHYVGHDTRAQRPILYVALRHGRVEGLAVLAGMDLRVAVRLTVAGVVARVEVLRLRDAHGTDVLERRFLRQFEGLSVADPVKIHGDIRASHGCRRPCAKAAQHVRHALQLARVWAQGNSQHRQPASGQ